MRIATTLSLLALLCLVSFQSFATGWPRQERQTYFQLGWRGFSTTTYYDGSTSMSVDQLSENSISLYGEYGYTSRLTGIVQLPGYRMLSLRTQAETRTVSVEAPGDVELGLQYAMWMNDDAAFTTSVVSSFPLGETSNLSGVWTGDGEYNQIFSFGYVRNLRFIPLSIAVSAGFNNRNNGYADEIHLGAVVGITGPGPVRLNVVFHAVEPLDNGKADYFGGRYGFATNRQRFLMYGPELELDIIDGFGVNFSAYGVSRMENVPSAVTFRSGVYIQFDRPQHEQPPAEE